jgi:hypothetical protein
MSVDIDQQLRALGQRLEHDAPPVGVDDVVSRLQLRGSATGSGDVETPLEPSTEGSSNRSRVRRRSTVGAAAVLVAMGLFGLVIANRATIDEPTPPSAAPDDATIEAAIPEPAVFPIVGEQAGPNDFGNFSMAGRENPERINALVARRDGNELNDGLWITLTLTAPADAPPPPAGTAPAEAVGEQVFDIHGRTADVWTGPFEVPVQHVRFHGDPVLEVTGVDALAFMQAAGPDAVRMVSTGAEPPFALQVGDLPAGYELIIEPFRERLGSLGASISVGNTDATEGNYVGVSLTNPLAATAAYNDTLTSVDINGQPGWLGSGPGNYLIWEPAPGTYATAGATNSPDESIALARSVQFVDRATWQTFYDIADPNF